MRRRLLGGQRQGLFHKRLRVLQSEGQSAHAIRAGLIGGIDQHATGSFASLRLRACRPNLDRYAMNLVLSYVPFN